MDPKIELHVHLEGTVRAPALLRIAQPQRVRAARHDRGRAGGALRVPRLRPLHRALDHDHARDPHRGRLPRGGRRLRPRGRGARRRVPGGDLHAGRAGADRRVVGRGVHRLLRRRGRGRGGDRRDRAPHARHPARLPARGRARDRALRGEVRRARRGGPRARRAGGAAPTRAVRRGVPRREGRRPRLGPARGRGRRARVDPRRARRPRRRPAAARHPRRRGRRPAAPSSPIARIVCDVCPVSNVRTRAVASLAEHPLPAMLAAGVPCSISTDDPAMFAHRPHGRLRGRGARSGCRPRPRSRPGSRARSATTPPAPGCAASATAHAWR